MMIRSSFRSAVLARTQVVRFQRAKYHNAHVDAFADLPPSEGLDRRRRDYIIQPTTGPSIIEKAEGIVWEYSHIVFRALVGPSFIAAHPTSLDLDSPLLPRFTPALAIAAYLYHRAGNPSYDLWLRLKCFSMY